MNRVDLVREKMRQKKLDALILTSLANIRYTSGFTGSTATVLVTLDRSIILVDARYTLQAGQECPGFEIVNYSGDALKAASELINEIAPARLGFEAEHITYSAHARLRSGVSKETRLSSTKQLVEAIRYVKEPEEIENIRRAVAIADDCFSYIIKRIKPGMTEREVALDIDTFMRKHGAEMQGFESIVAAGPNAAFPHHKPTDAVLQTGQMVKLDYGALLDGYNSDITRTIFLGEPDDKQREVYGVVLEAQLAAIDAIRPGKTGQEIDAVARDLITSKGYGDNFGHGLGHSLGIEVHDGPGFSKTSEVVLRPGMVMTVEPGIYIEGWGGVRIEDDIIVRDNGAEILTRSTKDIVVIR